MHFANQIQAQPIWTPHVKDVKSAVNSGIAALHLTNNAFGSISEYTVRN